jgi:RimJ/RimL family protein N-acetyltransferase
MSNMSVYAKGDFSMTVTLREVIDSDLPVFFQHQQDQEAVQMAAFTSEDPSDRAAFDAHWARIRASETVINRAVEVDGKLAGHVASFEMFGEREVTYWIGREFWGQGIATAALHAFLKVDTTRPLYARAAKDNTRSIRVLEKCGFIFIGEERGFANARKAKIDEVILKLD